MTNVNGRIAVIPARGGSKRIPRKNIESFCGRPMITYAISIAIESGLFDHVVVSTDDYEIADIARASGAEVPFERPGRLSDDDTPTVPVIRHAISECLTLGWDFDVVCCIYPCVPFLRVEDLKDSQQLFDSAKIEFCFSVVEFSSPAQRALKMDDIGVVAPLFSEFELSRTQDLEKSFSDAGQFYWGTNQAWLETKSIHSNAVGYVLPAWRSIDIDTPEDWRRAETMAKVISSSSFNTDL